MNPETSVMDETETEREDIEKNKVMGILAYIFFFVPLLAARDSKFAMFHANQGLVLFLGAIIVNFVGTMIPVIGWFLIVPFGNLLILVLAILGIINAANGKFAKLPLIGGISLLK